MSKRYLVFHGDKYYAHGGSSDLVGAADTIDEAKKIAADKVVDAGSEWVNCYDTKEGCMVPISDLTDQSSA